ncbi:imidazole glycerol phosphate synthase subunit HisH [uncultured Ruthenibacterium sp.]|uniref:imidazole glycerol phosphate synthase subunit HisH n=1 Tax=uncultured Ruthenibacterium sp. TaxID=1905347 RepID=UPI00349E8F98
MIALVDYGVGNLFSLCSSLMAIGAEVCVTGDPKKIRAADKVVLPGVGAFGDAAFLLHNNGLDVEVQRAAQAGKPLLGICLGMQLLLDQSLEYGVHTGLGLIPGTVRPIRPLIPAGYKVPHIGWNTLQFADGGPVHPLFSHIHAGDCVYFVHSYYAESPDEVVIARTEYGSLLTAAVAQDNVMGVQFHPEKSGDVGLNILRAFCEME